MLPTTQHPSLQLQVSVQQQLSSPSKLGSSTTGLQRWQSSMLPHGLSMSMKSHTQTHAQSHTVSRTHLHTHQRIQNFRNGGEFLQKSFNDFFRRFPPKISAYPPKFHISPKISDDLFSIGGGNHFAKFIYCHYSFFPRGRGQAPLPTSMGGPWLD